MNVDKRLFTGLSICVASLALVAISLLGSGGANELATHDSVVTNAEPSPTQRLVARETRATPAEPEVISSNVESTEVDETPASPEAVLQVRDWWKDEAFATQREITEILREGGEDSAERIKATLEAFRAKSQARLAAAEAGGER